MNKTYIEIKDGKRSRAISDRENEQKSAVFPNSTRQDNNDSLTVIKGMERGKVK